MFDVLDLPMDWPVDVNYHEAKAYCRWLGPECRLPTEAEFQCIRDTRVINCLLYFVYLVIPEGKGHVVLFGCIWIMDTW